MNKLTAGCPSSVAKLECGNLIIKPSAWMIEQAQLNVKTIGLIEPA